MRTVAKLGAVWCGLATIAASLSASPVTLVGTLRDTAGKRLDGTVMVVRMEPGIDISHYQVDASGAFKIASEARGDLVVHARALGHTSSEIIVPAGTSGTVSLNLLLPAAQDVEGRVVDVRGSGIPGATLQVRYSEPGKPIRRVSLYEEAVSDGDGRFTLPDVGIEVPFVVDVYASGFVAASSQQFKISAGRDKPLENITLAEVGATVTVRLLNKSDAPVPGAEVAMTADPSGRSARDRGSWLHHKSFLQAARTSSLGSVRFDGVPPGRIRVRAKTQGGVVEEYTVVSSGQEHRLTLRAQE